MRRAARAVAPLRLLLARDVGAAAPARAAPSRACANNDGGASRASGDLGGGDPHNNGARWASTLTAAPPPPPTTTPTTTTSAMRVLVTGAAGQIGSDLVPFLARRLAPGAVLATDVRLPTPTPTSATAATAATAAANRHHAAAFTTLDCTDAAGFARLAREHGATHIVHLAALLSARCEEDPDLAIRVNSRGTEAALAAARAQGAALILPSTIGVYGLSAEARLAGGVSSDDPDADPGRPRTLYGVTKAYAEGLGGWYTRRHGVDFRALRLPGVLSASAPGGGTTDYALHMLERAAEGVMMAAAASPHLATTPAAPSSYRCFVSEGVALPFMHASDTLRAFWRLLSAPRARLSRAVYNVGAVTATPRDWHAAFERAMAAREEEEEEALVGGGGGRRRLRPSSSSSVAPPPPPLLSVEYAPDHRDAIARSWPAALDCSAAARDWGYAPEVADVDAIARRLLAERLEALGAGGATRAAAVAETAAASAASAAAQAPLVMPLPTAAAAARYSVAAVAAA